MDILDQIWIALVLMMAGMFIWFHRARMAHERRTKNRAPDA